MVCTAIGVVVNVKLAVVAPARTVTEAGTVKTALSEANVTTAPPAGAAVLSVTVLTVYDLPPVIPPP